MTRGAFLKKYFVRFAVSLTLLGLIVYTVYQAFASTSGSLMTTPVQLHEEQRTVSAEAYLFRDEEVLTTSQAGLINDLAQSGLKVSKDVRLTEVYVGGEAETLAQRQADLDRINRLIRVLEDGAVSADTTLSQASAYRAEANADYLEIRRAVETGDWSRLSSLEESMLTMLNRYGVLTNPDEGVAETLAALKNARASLLTGTPLTVSNTRASGYFYDRTLVDGREAIFTSAVLKDLTPARLSELWQTPTDGSGFAVGKMVYGYGWYLAVPMQASSRALFETDGEYTFVFPENQEISLTMTCTQITSDENGDFVAVFFADEVPTDFVYFRIQRVRITVGEISGFHIPETALHTVNGVEGVYVFENSAVYFRRVDILYRGDGYCIASAETDAKEGYLALRDILVTSGKELYDGRVYR